MSFGPTVDRPSGAPAFGGAGKVGTSVFSNAENRFVDRNIDRVPTGIETYHLTLLTLIWSAGMVLFGWMAASNPIWLFAMSAMVIAQYGTDLFDGKIGKKRGTGLVKWGFFMDHFLDFVFSGSVVIAFSLLAPAGMGTWFLALLLATGAMMVLSFLAFAATNEFRIAFFGVGPTEVRLAYVALNTIVFFAGTGIFALGVPMMLGLHVVAVAVVAYRIHKQLWAIDMTAKAADHEQLQVVEQAA